MKYYRLEYKNGHKQVVKAKSDLELVRNYDLTSRENVHTRIVQLENDALDAVIQALELTSK